MLVVELWRELQTQTQMQMQKQLQGELWVGLWPTRNRSMQVASNGASTRWDRALSVLIVLVVVLAVRTQLQGRWQRWRDLCRCSLVEWSKVKLPNGNVSLPIRPQRDGQQHHNSAIAATTATAPDRWQSLVGLMTTTTSQHHDTPLMHSRSLHPTRGRTDFWPYRCIPL